jgi:hypothetical protein
MLTHVDECWVLPKEALQAPTVGKALTLIEECFFHAQSELRRLISSLKVKASSWGTPPDIVEHHCGQITTLLARIPAKHRADVR